MVIRGGKRKNQYTFAFVRGNVHKTPITLTFKQRVYEARQLSQSKLAQAFAVGVTADCILNVVSDAIRALF